MSIESALERIAKVLESWTPILHVLDNRIINPDHISRTSDSINLEVPPLTSEVPSRTPSLNTLADGVQKAYESLGEDRKEIDKIFKKYKITDLSQLKECDYNSLLGEVLALVYV